MRSTFEELFARAFGVYLNWLGRLAKVDEETMRELKAIQTSIHVGWPEKRP